MNSDSLLERAKQLKLYGIMSHWDEVRETVWIKNLIDWEEKERINHSLERRLKNARIGRFKPIAHFDWNWPKKCDREAVEELMQLDFIKKSTNVILCGPNGAGKTMIAKNIAYLATIRGHSVLFTSASQMLSDLAALDSNSALRRRTKYYVQPAILVVDEIGYLSYSSRYADLLFDIVSQRDNDKSTIITTNKPFAEWNEIFPNASCVVSIIDRLVHHFVLWWVQTSTLWHYEEILHTYLQSCWDTKLRATAHELLRDVTLSRGPESIDCQVAA